MRCQAGTGYPLNQTPYNYHYRQQTAGMVTPAKRTVTRTKRTNNSCAGIVEERVNLGEGVQEVYIPAIRGVHGVSVAVAGALNLVRRSSLDF